MNKLSVGSNMRWESSRIMLPEHKELLIKERKNKNNTMKPTLDEQELEEINIVIYDSLNYTLPIQLSVWKDGYSKTIRGIVSKIDYISKVVSIECDDELMKVVYDSITKTERI
ncbi:YolD-like family protein [Robertmurraya massiliosenegalensis]|uniref:YolD-like family protein n=1 Tax=Robertmurraya massiliosenegalensis TaxID=1287657 RepID=UPI000373911A|nr:YolD-like family protein [Robertmurraya massiliosenegalensis]